MSLSSEEYKSLYRRSADQPEEFWAGIARRLDWVTFPTIVKNSSFHAPVSIKWFEDGVLNACYNCVDRHLTTRASDPAILWEGDEPGTSRTLTYQTLHDQICRLANGLKSHGVQKGDRVVIYMPMVPEAAVAMLACARIGAVHSVVFGGFSPEALKDRILDCDAKILITADEGFRGGKAIPLKANADVALKSCPDVETVIVLQRSPFSDPPASRGNLAAARDIWWHDLVQDQPSGCPCEPMNAEDPLFILYTSGSTGKPKGVVHTTGGYMVYASYTHELAFDYRPGEVYWCTADVGWVTGHSYIVYGPLANGATTLMFEGVPSYPDWGRFWEIVDKYKVASFYTAPTAIRSLLRAGDGFVRQSSRASLRILGTVGEPINPEAWQWYRDVVGGGRCPVVDTWWQTETGGHMILPLPGAVPAKPGAAGLPFFGVKPVIVDQAGHILEEECEGALCIADSWPGMMRTIHGDHARFEQTYFAAFPGKYFTGDGARRDADGHYWITGRVDDVLNVSGHRLGTAEIEAAINRHGSVAESAVVGTPHDIKGQGIYAYVTLKAGVAPDDALKKDILATVRSVIGPIAAPDVVQWAPALPKTRSGKIMRRILRKIAAGETGSLGDISTLADPAVVEDLIRNRPI